jgi:hypothetical protein
MDVTDLHQGASPTLAPAAAARCLAQAAAVCPDPDLGRAASGLLAALVEFTGAARGSILLLDPANGLLTMVAALGLRQDLLGRAFPPRPRSISEWVFRNRRGLILNGDVRDQRFEASASAEGIESALSLPLIAAGAPIGVVNLARLSPAPAFAEAEMSALEAHLGPVADALRRLTRARSALRTAACLEGRPAGSGSGLLPPGPLEVRRYELALACRPADTPAGDLCERVPHPGGDHSLLMLDPPGVGGIAAATAAFLQGLFIALAAPERSMAGMAARLGSELHQRLGPRHATAAWVAQLSSGGEVRYCSAGHSPALWLPADGSEVAFLGQGGPILGVLAAARYEEEHLRLLPGDVLLLASDGVLGARGPTDRPFGVAALAELAAGQRKRPLEHLAASVIEAVVEFSGRPVPADDLTVLAVRFRPGD